MVMSCIKYPYDIYQRTLGTALGGSCGAVDFQWREVTCSTSCGPVVSVRFNVVLVEPLISNGVRWRAPQVVDRLCPSVFNGGICRTDLLLCLWGPVGDLYLGVWVSLYSTPSYFDHAHLYTFLEIYCTLPDRERESFVTIATGVSSRRRKLQSIARLGNDVPLGEAFWGR